MRRLPDDASDDHWDHPDESRAAPSRCCITTIRLPAQSADELRTHATSALCRLVVDFDHFRMNAAPKVAGV